MGGAIYREKSYICGEYLDVFVFPVYRRPGKRGKKAKPSTAAQAKLNERHSAEKLARQLHANFTPEDCEIGFDYAENPECSEQARRDIQNYIRRLRRLREKNALSPLKYICVTERSGRGRYHHHLTVNGGLDRDEMEKLWGHGRANCHRLQFSESGLTGLARYITKSPVTAKRWNASRNLVDPEPRTNDSRIRSRRRAAALVRDTEDGNPWEAMHPGYRLAEVVPFHNDDNGGIYIFARLYRASGGKTAQHWKRRSVESHDYSIGDTG